MKNLRDYLIVAGLLLSSTAFSQTPGGADVPVSASHYKTYHGDGIDDVLAELREVEEELVGML